MPQPREFAPPGKFVMIGTQNYSPRNFFREALERPIDSFHEALRASAERDDPPDWLSQYGEFAGKYRSLKAKLDDIQRTAWSSDAILAEGGLDVGPWG